MTSVDEFTYPPHVQEALDLIERETKAYERKERQANCPHEHTRTVDMRTMADETAVTMTWCDDCGYTTCPATRTPS